MEMEKPNKKIAKDIVEGNGGVFKRSKELNILV